MDHDIPHSSWNWGRAQARKLDSNQTATAWCKASTLGHGHAVPPGSTGRTLRRTYGPGLRRHGAAAGSYPHWHTDWTTTSPAPGGALPLSMTLQWWTRLRAE